MSQLSAKLPPLSPGQLSRPRSSVFTKPARARANRAEMEEKSQSGSGIGFARVGSRHFLVSCPAKPFTFWARVSSERARNGNGNGNEKTKDGHFHCFPIDAREVQTRPRFARSLFCRSLLQFLAATSPRTPSELNQRPSGPSAAQTDNGQGQRQ